MTNSQTNKIQVMVIHSKQVSNNTYACSRCFAEIDPHDDYCWSCGSELASGVEDIYAYSSDDLKESEQL